jgi:putative sterol carrier protein
MAHVLGTQPWLDAVREAINASEDYANAANDWDWPVGLAFRGEGDVPTRLCVLDLVAGVCRDATVADEATFAAAPFRISASLDRWLEVLEGRFEPMRALVLHRLQCEGDRLTLVRHMACAKALLEAVRTVEVEVPAPA